MPYAKHESFHLREGWLAKGLRAVEHDETILRLDRAPIVLGLGRNMVRSLQFWLTATGLVQSIPGGHVLTPLGKLVRQHDPYQEDIGTLWVIHYQLVCSEDNATAWYWFFNHFANAEFDQQTFVTELGQWAIAHEERKPLSPRTLENEFQTLIRTYLPSAREYTPEDGMDSPLTDLRLLEAIGGRRYRLRQPDPTRLPPLILLYALLASTSETQTGLAQALLAPRSPGRAFNLGAAALLEVLAQLGLRYPNVAVYLTRTAGLDRLTLPRGESLEAVLHRYYQERGAREA